MRETLRQFGWTAYDHLGGLVLLNLIWTGLSLPWLGAGVALFGVGRGLGGGAALCAGLVALDLVLLSPPSVLLFLAGWNWARKKEFRMGTLFRSLPGYALRAQGVGLMVAGLHLLFLANAFFYARFSGWIGLVLEWVMIWSVLGVGLAALFTFPLLVSQGGGVRGIFRQSLLLAVDNIGCSLGLLTAVSTGLLLGALSGIGLFCGMLALLALLICVCFRRLASRYTGEPLPEEPFRTWRELLRPWEH